MDDARRERRERKKDKVAALLADEALVAEMVQQHLKACSGTNALCSAAAVEDQDDVEEATVASRRAEQGKKLVQESVMRERLRLLALRVDDVDPDGPRLSGELARHEDLREGVKAAAGTLDLRDIQTGDVVHSEIMADIDAGDGFSDGGKRARVGLGAVADSIADATLRPGPGGVLQRRSDAPGNDIQDVSDAAAEAEASERQLEDAAYQRLLTSADTRRRGRCAGGSGDAGEVWKPGGAVREAFMRSRHGGGSEDEEEADDVAAAGSTGQQLLEAQVLCCAPFMRAWQ